MTPKPRTIDRIADVRARLILARDQHGVLMRCGLTTEADTIQRRINALNVELRDLEQLNEREQQATKVLLYECFVGCDLLTELADDFAAAIDRTSWGELKREDNAFAKMLRQQAKECNEIVTLVDQGGKGERASMYYADMAEQAVEAAREAIKAIVNDHLQKTHLL